jgi:hypothetical protein
MLIDPETFKMFITPRRIGECFGMDVVSDKRRELLVVSVTRKYFSYCALPEIEQGFLVATLPEERDGGIYFDIAPSFHYPEIVSAVAFECVWSDQLRGVDYPATIERWARALEQQQVDIDFIDRIKSNDLNRPEFGDFKITLMEYLLTCNRRGNVYFRAEEFEAVRPSS